MTEVNHEPGPSTTQSALADRGHRLRAGGRVGRHEAHRTAPRRGSTATCAWPRTTLHGIRVGGVAAR